MSPNAALWVSVSLGPVALGTSIFYDHLTEVGVRTYSILPLITWKLPFVFFYCF